MVVLSGAKLDINHADMKNHFSLTRIFQWGLRFAGIKKAGRRKGKYKQNDFE